MSDALESALAAVARMSGGSEVPELAWRGWLADRSGKHRNQEEDGEKLYPPVRPGDA